MVVVDAHHSGCGGGMGTVRDDIKCLICRLESVRECAIRNAVKKYPLRKCEKDTKILGVSCVKRITIFPQSVKK